MLYKPDLRILETWNSNIALDRVTLGTAGQVGTKEDLALMLRTGTDRVTGFQFNYDPASILPWSLSVIKHDAVEKHPVP